MNSLPVVALASFVATFLTIWLCEYVGEDPSLIESMILFVLILSVLDGAK